MLKTPLILILLPSAGCATNPDIQHMRVSISQIVESPDRWLGEIQRASAVELSGQSTGCPSLFKQRPALLEVLGKANRTDIKEARMLIETDDDNGFAAIRLDSTRIAPGLGDISIEIKIKRGVCVGWNVGALIAN